MIESTTSSMYIQQISEIMAKEVFVISVEHFAVPLILGISLDYTTEQQWLQMGQRLPMPPPLKDKHKVTLYRRIKQHFEKSLLPKITEKVNEALNTFSKSCTEEKLKGIAERVEKMDKCQEEKWERFHSLFQDHTCLYKELKAKSGFNFDVDSLHEYLCPIMVEERDRKGLFEKIRVDEVIRINDLGQ